MQSRKYHHGNLRQALVQEAIQVIAEDGVDGLTLRRIARQIGVSHAAPYRHFDNLNALLVEVAQVGVEALQAAVAAAAGEDKPALRMVQAYVHFARDNHDWFRLVFAHGDVDPIVAQFKALRTDDGNSPGAALLCAAHGLTAFPDVDQDAVVGAVEGALSSSLASAEAK